MFQYFPSQWSVTIHCRLFSLELRITISNWDAILNEVLIVKMFIIALILLNYGATVVSTKR